MEKLIYLLGRPEDVSAETLNADLHNTAIAQLKALGATRIRACIRDEHVEPAAAKRQGELSDSVWCYLSLWVPSRTKHPLLKAALEPVSSYLHGYAVAESEQLFHEFQSDGSRVEGMNEVVLFRKPESMDRAAWLQIWLESHTQVAIETQSTFGYIQHLVGDALDPDAPHFDAIVEENFPAGAMNSDEVFYDSEGNPEQLQERVKTMIDSVLRFIDMESIQVMPMSEYNF